MRTLIVCVSVSHGNTKKVADAMAAVLHARVVEPEQTAPADITESDLIGIGSGVFAMAFHPRLYRFVSGMAPGHGQRVFVFATRGWPEITSRGYMAVMSRILRAKGYEVIGTFSCRGLDTWVPLRLVGGLNKGHPDARDLKRARAFASSMTEKAGHVREHAHH